MFCPKCAAENPETNQYCRACRENLQVISQAMKNRLPVIIASKVDQILDSRSERFRRDSFLRLLMSLLLLTGCLISWKNGYDEHYLEIWFYLVAAIGFSWDALGEYRAYKRSLSPDFDWTSRDEDNVDSVSSRVSRFLNQDIKDFSLNWRGPGRSPTTHKESSEEAASAASFVGVSMPSVTESTTRQLDPSAAGARSECQSDVIYCPLCGRAGDPHSTRCVRCDVSLDLIAKALQPRELDPRTARLDRFIRKKTTGLAAASHSFRPFPWLLSLCLYIALFALGGSKLTPVWWYGLGIAVFYLVSGYWDRIAHRRNPSEPVPTVHIPDPIPPTTLQDWEGFSEYGRMPRMNEGAETPIDAEGSRPIRDWQRLYPNLWMLIEVTSEDEWGVSEGKLIATAEDHAEFLDLDIAHSDRYLVPVYGRP